MKDNTNKIKSEMHHILTVTNQWVDYVTQLNACAYSDRMLEEAIEQIKTSINNVEKLHYDQFKG